MKNNTADNYFTAIDVETTGLSPLKDRVIEIGCVAIKKNKIGDEFHSLINIETPVPQNVSKIHGITTEMLKGKPNMAEVISLFLEFIKDSTLIAHNASFDIGFLKNELLRQGMTLPNNYLCTLEMSRRLLPNLSRHRLETVAGHLLGGLPENITLHRAIDDARLVGKIWLKMKRG